MKLSWRCKHTIMPHLFTLLTLSSGRLQESESDLPLSPVVVGWTSSQKFPTLTPSGQLHLVLEGFFFSFHLALDLGAGALTALGQDPSHPGPLEDAGWSRALQGDRKSRVLC